jgi:hypothetical protein
LLSKLAEIYDDLFYDFFKIKKILTLEELSKTINAFDIKTELKESILSLYADISETEYRDKELTKIQLLSFIHESRNILYLSLKPSVYNYKKITEIIPITDEDKLFGMLCDANLDFLTGEYTKTDKIRAEIKKQLISKNIKNKFLINSYNRLLKLERYNYEQKK